MTDPLSHASVTERDIDLLIVEELNCSIPFARFVLATAFPSQAVQLATAEFSASAMHSVTASGQGAGESDIELAVEISSPPRLRLLLLIENKIDADFQPAQARRYAQRVQSQIRDGKADMGATLLVAPSDYIGVSEESLAFDSVLSYERLREFLTQRVSFVDSETARRLRHRSTMIDQAIGRFRRGYAAHPDPDVSAFVLEYWETANRDFPELRLKKPGSRPRNSTWIVFDTDLRKPNEMPLLTFRHKTGHGRVDIEVFGWAPYEKSIGAAMSANLLPKMQIRSVGRSLAFSLPVPQLDMGAPFHEQADRAEKCIGEANALRKWWNENAHLIPQPVEYR